MKKPGWFMTALRLAFVLGGAALAAESVSMSFNPDVPITSYRKAIKMVYKMSNIISSSSNGARVEDYVVEGFSERIDGLVEDITDEYTLTVGNLRDDASLPVTTVGDLVRLRLSKGGAKNAVKVSYGFDSLYQNEGQVLVSDFKFDTSKFSTEAAKAALAAAPDYQRERSADVARLYDVPLEPGVSVTSQQDGYLSAIDQGLQHVNTYTLTGRGANEEFLFDFTGASSAFAFSEIQPDGSGKFFFKILPGSGSGKTAFLADGRVQFEQYAQEVGIIYNFVTVQDGVSITVRLEGTISFSKTVDIVQ